MRDSKESGLGIPIGLGMAMSMNIDAMKYYSSLSDEGRREIIDRAVTIDSKEQMKQFVESLAEKSHGV